MVNRKRRGHSSKGVSVVELLELIPERLLDELSESLGVDKWVKKLKARYLFKLILFSLLSSERLSLRLMEDNFEDPIFRALAPALCDEQIGWTGIRERLMKVNSDFFQKLFIEVYQRAEQLYGVEPLHGYHIKRYDSTMIATFSHLLEGMKVGNTSKGKTQVKLTTELSDDFLIQLEFHQDQAYLSEEKALKELIEQANSSEQDLHVFDNGLKSRNSFQDFDTAGILFLTRLGKNPRYVLVHPHWQDTGQFDTPNLEFCQDSIVKLYKSGHQLLDTPFRLVQYRVKQDGTSLYFLTNLRDLSPQQIAQLYQQRWDIEVLFRFMKQEMNLSHFVCNELNAINVMLYCTLIASMLVLIYKKLNNLKSYKRAKIRFFKELMYAIFFEALNIPGERKRLRKAFNKFMQFNQLE